MCHAHLGIWGLGFCSNSLLKLESIASWLIAGTSHGLLPLSSLLTSLPSQWRPNLEAPYHLQSWHPSDNHHCVLWDMAVLREWASWVLNHPPEISFSHAWIWLSVPLPLPGEGPDSSVLACFPQHWSWLLLSSLFGKIPSVLRCCVGNPKLTARYTVIQFLREMSLLLHLLPANLPLPTKGH